MTPRKAEKLPLYMGGQTPSTLNELKENTRSIYMVSHTISTRAFCRLSAVRKTFEYSPEEIEKQLSTLPCIDVPRILAVRHVGKKKEVPHYHIVLEFNQPQTHDDVTKLFTRLFAKGKGNQHHSLVLADNNISTMSYLFHENIGAECIVFNRQYSDEDISVFIQVNQQTQASWVTPDELCKQIAQDLIIQRKGQATLQNHARQKVILERVFKAYQAKGSWLPDKRQCDRYYTRICSIIDGDNAFQYWFKANYPSKF